MAPTGPAPSTRNVPLPRLGQRPGLWQRTYTVARRTRSHSAALRVATQRTQALLAQRRTAP